MTRSHATLLNGQVTAPIVILTFGYSGAQSLESMLAGRTGLVCTSGTGILPLCAQAAAAWQQLERSPAGMSAMAASSVRALATTMITCTLVAARGSRWCETATAPGAAGTFARLFPQAQFVCFYRACAPVIADVTQASRWGLGNAGVEDFAAMYPGNSVAAVAAYWGAHTSAMLDFETVHSGRVLRVRHEDLMASTAATASSIVRFLGLDEPLPGLPGFPPDAEDMAMAADPPGTCTAQQIPVGLIPTPVLDRINSLHARLAYPALLQEPESGPAGLPDRLAGRR